MKRSTRAMLPTDTHREQGFAAAAALLALLIAGTIGTAMGELARLETSLARQRKATTAALAAVDTCVEAAVAALPVGWDFGDVLHGSDGLPGTADDGFVPLAANCSGAGRTAPGPAEPPRFLFAVEAASRGGRRRLDAVVRRQPEPGVPALLWATDPAALGRIDGRLSLDGDDVSRPRPPVAMLAAPGEPALLDAWVGAQGGAVVATGGTAPPIWAAPPPLAELVARAEAGGALSAAAGLVSSPPAVAQAMVSPVDLTVVVPSFGAGLLVVDGALRIEAPLTFTGVVAATGGVYVEATGAFVLQGALWLGAGGLEALVVEGSASIVASAAGLESADALLPLPRRARVASVRDF